MAMPIKLHSVTSPSCGTRVRCAACSLRGLCLPMGLNQGALGQLDSLTQDKRPIERGGYLFRPGSPLRSLYAIRVGSFKTSILHDDGREQVTGFYMTGELMGMDAIGSDVHTANAVALEDSELCEMPFDRLEQLAVEFPSLQRYFLRIMSREIVRDHGVMLLLGAMRAEERIAAFLLQLSKRYLARGYSPTRFSLRMSREEIGSYLGLTIETVSRVFSRLQAEGFISVQKREVCLNSIADLKKLIGQTDTNRQAHRAYPGLQAVA